MRIVEQYRPEALVELERCRRVTAEGEESWQEMAVIDEHSMEVILNETPVMQVVCTPQHLAELTLGRLYSEGMIPSTEAVDVIHICETGRQARVLLNTAPRLNPALPQVATCCSNNISMARWADMPALDVIPKPHWEREWVFQLAEQFAQGSPIHKKTVATHSCMLAVEGEILCLREDIGRHNALDKAIGWGLRQGVDLSRAMVYVSGRVPVDMVTKVIRAKIPVMVSKAAPTRQSIQLAREFGLTLIASARPDSMRQYTGFE